MAVWFPENYFSSKEVEYFKKKSTFVYKNRYGAEKVTELFRIDEKGYYFPIGLWTEMFDEIPKREFKTVEFECDISLTIRKSISQEDVVNEALKKLTRLGHCLLNIPTGTGKTRMSIYTACCLRKKTIIVSSVSVTLDQWMEDFIEFTTAKPQMIDTKCEILSDVVLCTPHTFKKRVNDLQSYGTIIIDEIHLHTRGILTSLLSYRPRYLIGLTATLKRGDGLVNALKVFFQDSIISRVEKKDGVIVHVINTGFSPQVKYKMNKGKRETDYNDLIKQLCENRERNIMISDHLTRYLTEGRLDKIEK